MNNVPEQVKALADTIIDLRAPFAAYIADKNIPLKDRWEVFKGAPTDLSNHENYIPDLKTFDVNEWSGGGDTSRGTVFQSVEWVEEWLVEGHERNSGPDILTEEEWTEVSKEFDPLREEILALNLKSWALDW